MYTLDQSTLLKYMYVTFNGWGSNIPWQMASLFGGRYFALFGPLILQLARSDDPQMIEKRYKKKGTRRTTSITEIRVHMKRELRNRSRVKVT